MYTVIDINNRKSCYYATIYFFHFFTHYFSQVTITLITTPVHELNDFFLQVTKDHSKMISSFFNNYPQTVL